jgi:WD40 repeat protein
MAPFKLPSFWGEKNPRARISPIVSLQLHPRDIGKLLIGYASGAVIYSFKQNAPQKFFEYELPRGAPGGDADPAHSNVVRHPMLTHALWHPTGTFVLTAYADSSLVFWDPVDGRIVMARTLEETNVNKPGPAAYNPAQEATKKDPYSRIAWCANQDPDDTALLISGGMASNSPTKGLTFLELGRTPNYTTSSWEVLSQHFGSPRRQRILPTPPNSAVVEFCLIPKADPHFSGAHDPLAILCLLSSGEIISMSFPSGYPISPTNQLPLSVTYVHPFITAIQLSPLERNQWLGLTEKRNHGPKFVEGGAEASRPLKRFESRNIVQTAHADGTVRLWDAGHGDEIENDALIQVDVERAVGRHGGLDITKMSFAGASGEFAAGTRTGEVAIFRWGHNKTAGREPPEPGPNKAGDLTDIQDRTEPSLIDGFVPLRLLDMQNGPCTALKVSDVGFIAAGFEGGKIAVIDLRGPAVIYNGNVQDFASQDRKGSLRRSSQTPAAKGEYASIIEFSVMSADGDSFSSLLLHVGTNKGHVATFKVVPEQGGRHGVHFAGAAALNDRVIRIAPINAQTGAFAYATQHAFGNLRNGYKVNGVLIAVTAAEARIFRPATNKGAHKSWDEFACTSAAVSRCGDGGYALVCLFQDGTARAFSIPALKEIGGAKIGDILDRNRLNDAIITETGDIFGWTGPSETTMLNIWGTGITINRSKDILFNPDLAIPPRPTISNFQWISGSQYVTPSDMDLLIGGPDRPPSKRMLAQARSDEIAARQANRANPQAAGAGNEDQGYWAYMQNQLNERTKNLNLMGDSVNKLEESSASWADQASKYVASQKRNMMFGGKFLLHHFAVYQGNDLTSLL